LNILGSSGTFWFW